MFEVGFTEILLIFGIALLVLGPARLPKLAADVGRWAGRARAMARQLRTQLEQEVNFDPLATPSATPGARPAASAAPTIHTAPAAPTSVDSDARAIPAQLAGDAAPPAAAAVLGQSVEVSVTEPTAAAATEPLPSPEAFLRPEKYVTDEPQPG